MKTLLDEFALVAPPCPEEFCPDATEDAEFNREYEKWNEVLSAGPFHLLSKYEQDMANSHSARMASISRRLAPFKWPYYWAEQVIKGRGHQ